MVDFNKCLTPWKTSTELHDNVPYYQRRNLHGAVVAEVFHSVVEREYVFHIDDTGYRYTYPIAEVVMSKCDEQLILLGYTLLTEKRAEKLMMLL